MKIFFSMLMAVTLYTAPSCAQKQQHTTGLKADKTMDSTPTKITRTDEQWRELLTPAQFSVLREKGTEAPFSGIYDKNFTEGTYYCAACKSALFSSKTKFDAGCGWPSFFAPLLENNVNIVIDRSHGMKRSEVTCAQCGSHLGHVFNDGPKPTGLRYCINSAALIFKSKAEIEKTSAK